MSGHYRADLWAHASVYVEVWAESRSIASVILDDCRELAVSLYPCGGFSSISFVHEAAEYMNATVEKETVVVLYVGDYDPAGVLIDVALERELRLHLDPRFAMHFWRLAITEEQIAEFDLPTKPRKESDRRSLHIGVAVEAEAMPARDLRELIRTNVEVWLPPDALRIAKVAEQSEQEQLQRMAELLGKAA